MIIPKPVFIDKYQSRIAYWDDFRNGGDGLIVTLKSGWRFAVECHTKSFNTVSETVVALRESEQCEGCVECRIIGNGYDTVKSDEKMRGLLVEKIEALGETFLAMSQEELDNWLNQLEEPLFYEYILMGVEGQTCPACGYESSNNYKIDHLVCDKCDFEELHK